MIDRIDAKQFVYVLGFPKNENESHITLLGAVEFSSLDRVNDFVKVIEPFLHSLDASEEKILESNVFKRLGMNVAVHHVQKSRNLEWIHTFLVVTARGFGGVFTDPGYANQGWLPHITHGDKCNLTAGDTILLSKIVVSRNPNEKFDPETSIDVLSVELDD